MKAAVYYETGGPEVLQYEDVPDPEVRPNGVLIEVAAVGIQGGDLLHRAGGEMAGSPHVVGYQAAGRVAEVGTAVSGVEVGQNVVATMAFGSHAELVSVHSAACYAVPAGVSIETAAAIPIEFATADDCLFEFGSLQAGETVLIHAGAGGVGLAAIQLAKAAGATASTTNAIRSRPRFSPTPTELASTWSSIRWAEARLRRASKHSHTAGASAGWARQDDRTTRPLYGRSCKRTARSPASSWAPRWA